VLAGDARTLDYGSLLQNLKAAQASQASAVEVSSQV
jgi:hypothetical protein